MKKFAKMSLVAAVAVAGLSTVSSAKPLAEAIKDVDVSGTVVYRYNDSTVKDGTSSVNNNYKIGLTAKAKVNDDVTAVTRFIVGGENGGWAGGNKGLDTQSAGDTNVDVTLSNVYFSYTGLANTTVNVGKQGLTTPWTVAIDPDGNEQTGTGILALSNVGPVTLAAAYFNQTNLNLVGTSKVPALNGSKDIITFAAMANIGPVALDAWYLDLDDTFDTYTVGANANFDLDAVKLGVDARYTALDLDGANQPDNNMFKIALTAKAGIFDAKYAFATSDKEGGLVSLDNDAKTDIQGWSVSMTDKADADFHQVVVGVQALPSLHISANYVTVDYTDTGADLEETEIYTQLTYNMSKNLKTYIRFGTQENENNTAGTKTETDYKGRLQVQYSF